MKRGSSVSEQFGRTVSTFAALGPPVGTGVVIVALVVNGIASGYRSLPDLGEAAGFVALALVAGYLLGIVPATIAGVICHFFASALQGDALWVLTSAAVGAVITGASGAMIGGLWADPVTDTLLTILFCTTPGAVAAAVCAVKLRKTRWA